MNSELRLLENYITGYAKAKDENERKLMFKQFEDKNIMGLVKTLQDRKQLKNLNQMQLFYLDEVLIVTKYYKELIQLINTYKLDSNYENDTAYLTNRYREMYKSHDAVELFLAYKMLNSNEKKFLRDIARKEPMPKNDTLAKRMVNIVDLFKNNISIDDIEVLANHYYLTYNVFSQAIDVYSKKCSNEDRETVLELSRQIYVKTNEKFGKMVFEIINSANHNELIKKYIDDGVTLEDIRKTLNNTRYSKLLSLKESDHAKLIDFLTDFSNYKKQEAEKVEMKKKEKEAVQKKFVTHQITLEEALKEIKKFAMSGYTTKVGYCVNCNVDIKYFEKCKSMVDATKVKRERKKTSNFVNVSKEIADKIRNGVQENGRTRSFDIIDFYMLTNSTITEVQNELANLPSTSDNNLIKKYLGKKTDISQNLSASRLIIGVKYDEQGKIIPNSGREITEEEKMNCIAYLEKNDLFVNALTIKDAAKRYINGFITFEKPKVKSI